MKDRREYNRKYYQKNKEILKAKVLIWRRANPEKVKIYQQKTDQNSKEQKTAYRKQKLLERKKIVFAHYGGKCECCGEARPEFLCIDHIDGGGNKHRRNIGLGGSVFYRWIIDNNFPGFLRILCHNCNAAYAFVGYCPHTINNVFLQGVDA